MNDQDICERLRVAVDEFENEVVEHKIRERYASYKDKLKSLKKKKPPWMYRFWIKRLKNKIDEYGEYLDAFHGLTQAYNIACEGKKGKLDCEGLQLGSDAWAEEIDKFRFLITLSGKTRFYKDIQDSVDDALDEFCKF